MYQQGDFRRRSSSSASSIASTMSWTSHRDDEVDHDDVFAPQHERRCVAATCASQHSAASTPPPSSPPPSASSSAAVRTCEGMTAAETRELWKCMLALQQRYGCYNSRRIDLAANAGDDGVKLMPNPFIIDTLNNSVIHLPDEGWEMLDRCLRHGESCATASSGGKGCKSKGEMLSRQ
ncbi:Cation-transporting ATPase [Purpureocillium lavendulum]|uniref:Cation-transporting ATPase n=1 Tax=Purpureocillium lavendulum TaxID=1247861 RepID=A0AB34FPM7_9HYPO|nr:Cation-transporting ATPase [Purpureocillium lavendulum]